MDLIIKKYFNNTIFFILLLFSSQNMAASVSDAVIASKNNNTVEEVKIWSQLADTGNSIAQYNLASHYFSGKGVQKNNVLAEEWLRDAARSGLIQAYTKLNKKAIAPANGKTISFIVGPVLWLKKQEPNRYTIQLASSRNEKSIKKSYEVNHFKGKGGYYHYVRDGVHRYALIYGSFKTVAEANVAIKGLPESLRKKTPWVRKIKSLQKISK